MKKVKVATDHLLALLEEEVDFLPTSYLPCCGPDLGVPLLEGSTGCNFQLCTQQLRQSPFAQDRRAIFRQDSRR